MNDAMEAQSDRHNAPHTIPLVKDKYGLYHPNDEADVIALIKFAAQKNAQIRVRGASHSVAWSIYTNPVGGLPENKVSVHHAPDSNDLNLILSNIADLVWIDETQGIIECGAGIHLGKDPYDADGPATIENSLLYQAWQKGWAVNITGGISHQTVAGFSQTGSAGGSTTYGFSNITAYRIIDGTGNAEWIDDSDDRFHAVAVSMGLLGIIVRVRMQLVPAYNIAGVEYTVPAGGNDCPVDLFGPGDAAKPSLEHYLQSKTYARMEWWPQAGAERVIFWEAARQDPAKSPTPPTPYYEFTPDFAGQTEQLAASILFTMLGNRGIGQSFAKLIPNYAKYARNLSQLFAGTVGGFFAGILSVIITIIIAALMLLPCLVFAIFPNFLISLFPKLLGIFQPMSGGKPTTFNDYYWRSLPMDNSADDVLLGSEFTEIWVPIKYTETCMKLLRDMFVKNGSAATGFFELEVYAAPPNQHWLSPSYSSGDDEFSDGAVRFDIFWYRANAGQPNQQDGFFAQYWELFRANGLPFRFHWGKFVPAYDFPYWAQYYAKTLPKFGEFLALRAQRDPHNLFFTEYWQQRLTGQTETEN
ncbi:MAG: hypothetical protein KAZ17_00875 [Sphingorhabdus sp.]|nr:hypothetical protein [Sphingorhabdus sp.]